MKMGSEPALAGDSAESSTLSPIFMGSKNYHAAILGLAPQALCLRLLRRLYGFGASVLGLLASM